MYKIKKLTSVKHRNTMLKVLHGDVYTNERKNRFGLREDPYCDRCNEIDTLEHRLSTCSATRELVSNMLRITNKVRISVPANEDVLNSILMANNSDSMGALTIHTEVIGTLISDKTIPLDTELYLNRLGQMLIRKEGNTQVKEELKTLFNG
jgi:hypothetical protein